MNLNIKPMDEVAARQITSWQYDYPYSIYNLENDGEAIKELLNGTYFKVLDEQNKVTGFFCYGESAQVPSGKREEAYGNKAYLDIGLGMNPKLCGHGMGDEFLRLGLSYAENTIGTRNFRLTVAEFNTRAIKVYKSAGFEKVLSFEIKRFSGLMTFIVMLRQ